MSLKLIHSRSKRWAKGDEILVYLCHSDSLVCCLLWYTLASDLIPSVKTSQKIHWRNFEALLWSTLVWYLQQEIMNQCIGLYLYMCVSIYLFVYTEDPSYLKGLSNFHSDHTLKHFSDIMKALKIFFLPHSFSDLRFEESEKCSPQLLSEISLKQKFPLRFFTATPLYCTVVCFPN